MNPRHWPKSSSKGTLTFDDSQPRIKVGDKQFGHLFEVHTKQPTYLYTKPPTKKIHKIAENKNSHVIPVNANEPFPAMIVDRDDGAVIGVQQQLQPGVRVLAREIPEHPEALEVVTFVEVGKKRADMTEAGDAINILNKGYMLKSQLRESEQRLETFEPDYRELFPTDNLLDDIRQSIFGDCFLLSSIIGILNQPGGEDYIKGMMIQSPDNKTTIVRLYDPDLGKYCFYEVENTLHHQDGAPTVRHGAPWVHMLEKAYTAHAQVKKIQVEPDKEYDYVYPSFRTIFGQGGVPYSAMQILTGEPAKNVVFADTCSYPWDSDSLIFCRAMYNHSSYLVDNISDQWLRQLEKYMNDILMTPGQKVFLRQCSADLKKIASALRKKQPLTLVDIQEVSSTIKEWRHNYPEKSPEYFFLNSIYEFIDSMQEGQDITNVINSLSIYIFDFVEVKVDQALPINQCLDSLRLITKLGRYISQISRQDNMAANQEIDHGNFVENDRKNFYKHLQNFMEAMRKSINGGALEMQALLSLRVDLLMNVYAQDSLQMQIFHCIYSRVYKENQDDPTARLHARVEMLNEFSEFIEQYKKSKNPALQLFTEFADGIEKVAEAGKFKKSLLPARNRWDIFQEAARLEQRHQTIDQVSASYNGLRRHIAEDQGLDEVIEKFDGLFVSQDEAVIRWNGPVGTGIYNDTAKNIYKEVKQKLKTKASLTASTKSTFPQIVPGLRHQHAYGIIGVKEEIINGVPLRFIRLRNPWGHTGRLYQWNIGENMKDDARVYAYEQKENAGEFDLELSEFCQYFEKYSVGRFTPPYRPEIVLGSGNEYGVQPVAIRKSLPPITGKVGGVVSGIMIGAAIGAVLGFLLAPVTMGASIVVFTAVGAVLGGALLGGLAGLGIGAIIDRRKKSAEHRYQALPAEEPASQVVSDQLSLSRSRERAVDHKHQPKAGPTVFAPALLSSKELDKISAKQRADESPTQRKK